jgi:hypothetical protein
MYSPSYLEVYDCQTHLASLCSKNTSLAYLGWDLFERVERFGTIRAWMNTSQYAIIILSSIVDSPQLQCD